MTIIRALPDVVFRCERRGDGKIYWTLNEGKLAEEFHLTTKEIAGRPLQELFPPETAARLQESFDRAFEGKSEEFVNELGGRFFKHHPQPVRDRNGNVTSVVGFITEVTSLELAQREIQALSDELARHLAELASANEELEAFTYTLSHDLRTPLTVILAQCEIMRMGLGDEPDPHAVRRIDMIRDAARRMNRLTEDILGLSRGTRREMREEHIDLSKMAEAVIDELRVREPSRIVTTRIQGGLGADGDSVLVRQVLDNLLSNAWKFTRKTEPAVIEFGAARKDGATRFFVRDNGAGFDAAQADGLFIPFRRLHKASDFEGTGVGLATVRKIVERHGGTVGANGEPGKGATFWFTLGPATR